MPDLTVEDMGRIASEQRERDIAAGRGPDHCDRVPGPTPPRTEGAIRFGLLLPLKDYDRLIAAADEERCKPRVLAEMMVRDALDLRDHLIRSMHKHPRIEEDILRIVRNEGGSCSSFILFDTLRRECDHYGPDEIEALNALDERDELIVIGDGLDALVKLPEGGQGS